MKEAMILGSPRDEKATSAFDDKKRVNRWRKDMDVRTSCRDFSLNSQHFYFLNIYYRCHDYPKLHIWKLNDFDNTCVDLHNLRNFKVKKGIKTTNIISYDLHL